MIADIATLMDFQITLVALIRTSRKQEFQEVGENLKAIDARLDREIAEKKRYREENIRLREYIAGTRRGDPTLISPIALDHGMHSHYEAARGTLSEVEKWIENTRKQVDDFLTQFVHAYDRTTGLAFRIQYLEGVWEEFRPIQEKAIPCLQALKKVPNSTLVSENIVHNGDRYDFHGWYCSLAVKKSTYENAQSSCMEMEGLIQDIQMKILASIKELLGVDVSDASG